MIRHSNPVQGQRACHVSLDPNATTADQRVIDKVSRATGR
jgi:hypothetical protein